MQGRLKAIALISSQEQWRLDLTDISATGAAGGHVHLQPPPDPGLGDPGGHGHHQASPQRGRATRGSNGQPQAPQHQGHISAPCTTSRAACDSAPPPPRHKHAALSIPEPTESDDDDDFMPPKKHHVSTSVSRGSSGAMLHRTLASGDATTGQASNYAVKYRSLPSARCVPSFFNKFPEHLTMLQRKKISEMGFGGLLQFSAEGLDNRGLLVFLMDKLNPDSMILEVGHQGGLQINPLAVNKVLGITIGDKDPPSSTEEENARALVEFRKLVHVAENKDVKCKHLLDLISKLALDNDLVIRIFFIVAFNKLLFPASDNNIRGQDAFMTRDFSQFHDINWCKAVVDELRHAAITWRSDKKKSIPGCSIFLIILYLDNLQCRSSIGHINTARAKFFHQYVMEKIIHEDKKKDRSGKETYGQLPLRNIANTCYSFTEPTHNDVPAVADSASIPKFPCLQEELGGLVSQIATTLESNQASDGMKLFDSKASQAIRSIQMGSQMLVDAHKEFVHTMRNIFEKEVAERRRKYQDPHAPRPTNNGPGDEKQSRSNVEASPFLHYRSSPIEQTDAQRHSASTSMIGYGPIQQAAMAQDEHVINLQREAYSDGSQHTDNDGVPQYDLAAPSPAATAQQITTESIIYGTPFRMATAMDSFAPDIEAVIEEASQAEKLGRAKESTKTTSNKSVVNVDSTVTDPINQDHVHLAPAIHEFQVGESPTTGVAEAQNMVPNNVVLPVQINANEDSNIASQSQLQISHIPTSLLPQDPATTKPAEFSELAHCTTAHVMQDQDLPDLSTDPQSTSNFFANCNTPVDEEMDVTVMCAATQDESGYHIRARPPVHRIVNVPTRYRSPFRCVTPRPPIDMMKDLAVRRKFCTHLNTRKKIFIAGPTQLFRGINIAESFYDGATLWKQFMSYFVECLRADDKFYKPKCVGYRVFLSAGLGDILNHDDQSLPTYANLPARRCLETDLYDLDLQKVKLKRVSHLRSEMLYYMLFHRLNDNKRLLPANLKALGPQRHP